MRSFSPWRSTLPVHLNVARLLVVAVAAAALMALIQFARASQAEHARAGDLALESARISWAVQSLLPQLSLAQAAMCDFLISGREESLASHKTIREKLLVDLERIEHTFNQDASRWVGLRQLRPLIEKHLNVLSQLRQYAALPGLERTAPPVDLLVQGENLLKQSEDLTRRLRGDEDLRLQNASSLAQQAQRRADLLSLGAVILVWTAGIAGVWFLTNRSMVDERRRTQASVQDSQRQLEAMLGRSQEQAQDLAVSREELRRHQEMLESVLDSLSDGVAVVASGGELLRFNPAAARIFASLPAISMEQWAAYYGLRSVDGGPDQSSNASFAIARALQGEHTLEQTVFVPKDEGGLWLRLSARPLLTPNGELRAVLVVFTDITVHHQHEEFLSRARDAAEQANQAKSEFLSRMSHELRTPLNAILGFAQLLEMGRLDPASSDSVNQILRAGRHLLTLINEVLEIARIESGRLALSPEPVQLAELMAETTAMLRPQAQSSGIQLENKIAAEDLYVVADRQRLRQVVLNLMSNALKYNRQEGLVTLTCEPAQEGRVRLMVADTGHGIPAELLDKLFQPFERLGADRTGIEGTGIGLALSKRLVEAMGGEIGVETSANGTTFWVELPGAQNPLESLLTLQDHLSSASAEAELPSVLCIEDNPSNLQLIERILSSRPEIRLLTAIDGLSGLQMAREHHPNLILLDVHLPDINGDEVLRRLKADPETAAIPVIIVSADATSRQEARLREAGASDYLTKPLDIPKFLATIEGTLNYANTR